MGGLEGLLQSEPGLLEPGLDARRTRGLSDEAKRRAKTARGRNIAMKLGCEWGAEACGVYGGSRKAWECVDTMTDLESCAYWFFFS